MGTILNPHFQSTILLSSLNSPLISIPSLSFSNSIAGVKWVPSLSKLTGRNQSKTRTHSPKAVASDEGETTEIVVNEPKDADFEERLSRIRTKGRSGSGKKAELRKLKKAGMDPSKRKSSRKTGILLPPVPLKDPISDGLKVELGFNAYTERLNGRFAALGLVALLLVELASGQSLIKYHAPGTLILQIYFIFAMSALFVKYEKEKNSIWPKNKS